MILGPVAKLRRKRNDLAPLKAWGSPAATPERMDEEEARIFRQSLPAEPITRDFLEELLQEYQANQQHKPS